MRAIGIGAVFASLSCNTVPPCPSGGTGSWTLTAASERVYVGAVSVGHEIAEWAGSRNTIFIVDALTGQRSSSARMPEDRARASFAMSPDYAIVWGGALSKPAGEFLEFIDEPSVFLWERDSDSWSKHPFPEYLKAGIDYDVHWTGEEFITWGGWNDEGALVSGARFDPETLSWAPMDQGDAPEAQGATIWTEQGLFLWTYTPNDPATAAYLYSTEESRWTSLAMEDGPTARFPELATGGGKVYLVGGNVFDEGEMGRYEYTDGYHYEVWSFDLQSHEWESIETPQEVAIGPRATWAGGRLYMFSLDCTSGSYYDPESDEWGVMTSVGGPRSPSHLFEIDGKLVTYGEYEHPTEYGTVFVYEP